MSESYGHEDLRQTRQYLGLVIDEQRDVGLRRAEYLERIKKRMQQGLPPEKDFSQRIAR
ncbi:MAG: hypothetical protein KBH31_00275 [Methanomassiliicoccales archaeon]|nr:hypothetical protein [Methanomassiliicoccales archaeon]